MYSFEVYKTQITEFYSHHCKSVFKHFHHLGTITPNFHTQPQANC